MSVKVVRRRMSTSDTRRRRRTLMLHHGPFCAICGRLILLRDRTVDHGRALARGGSNRLENLQLAHRACNEAKAAS